MKTITQSAYRALLCCLLSLAAPISRAMEQNNLVRFYQYPVQLPFLTDAIAKKDVLTVVELLDKEPLYADACNDEGQNILHCAAIAGWNHKDLKTLCEHTAVRSKLKTKLDQRNLYYCPPLLTAVHWGNIEAAQCFIEYGASIDVVGLRQTLDDERNLQSNILHCAVYAQLTYEQLQTLFTHILNQEKTNVNKLKILLHQKDANGLTPLVLAIAKKNIDATLFYIDQGESIDTTFNEKLCHNILYYATLSKWDYDQLATLCKHPAINKKFKALLEQKDSKNRTPLHLALLEQNLSATLLFLKNGASLTFADDKKPLYESKTCYRTINHAALAGKLSRESLSLLCTAIYETNGLFNFLKEEPEPEKLRHFLALLLHYKSPVSGTIFHEITIYSTKERLEFLLNLLKENLKHPHRNLQTLLSKTDDAGNTPLFFARGPAMARLLLDHGVNVNTQNKKRETHLHWAALEGNIELIKFLLEKEADPCILSYNNHTFYDFFTAGLEERAKVHMKEIEKEAQERIKKSDIDNKIKKLIDPKVRLEQEIKKLVHEKAWEKTKEFNKVVGPILGKIIAEKYGLVVEYYKKKTGEELPSCSMCSESIQPNDEIIRLGCDHIFHYLCDSPLSVYFLKMPKCPVCREDLDDTSCLLLDDSLSKKRKRPILYGNTNAII